MLKSKGMRGLLASALVKIAIEAQNYFAQASAICIKCGMSVTQKDHGLSGMPAAARPSFGQVLGWPVATALVALLVAAPILAVLWSLTQTSGDAWAHLSSTVLPGYVGNTLLLMLLVAVMTMLLGVGSAWLIVSFEFPGQRVLSWALGPATRDAGLYHRLRLHRSSGVCRASPVGIAEPDRLERGRVLFPADPLPWRVRL